MGSTPTPRIKKNIAKFTSMWAAGDMVACKESYEAAQRYLDMFGDWLFENMEPAHDQLVGVIEYTNFHDRAETSVKNWKLKDETI